MLLSSCNKSQLKSKKMKQKTIKTNVWGIEPGDVIAFTGKQKQPVRITVTRVEEKSWYELGRNSYGTLQRLTKLPDFKIIKHS